MKSRPAACEIDALIPALHGAINLLASSKSRLAHLFFPMLQRQTSTAAEYRAALEEEIATAREALVTELGKDDHQPDLVTFDQDAAQIRSAVEAVFTGPGR
ncbi:MAG: hypothetical protein PHI23_01635 [Candidatus Peribacteraceae bacterium]|nr:hypothetical protein [Candidatus Peribacteraceae bacterium]